MGKSKNSGLSPKKIASLLLQDGWEYATSKTKKKTIQDYGPAAMAKIKRAQKHLPDRAPIDAFSESGLSVQFAKADETVLLPVQDQQSVSKRAVRIIERQTGLNLIIE